MPDYFAAARRHLDDGDLLRQHARHANAVQLWAYGGECTLKAIALQKGYFQLDATGKPTHHFGQHLNQTNKNVPDLLSLYNARQEGTTALMGPRTAFVGWDIHQRYEDGAQLHANIDEYQRDANAFRGMLNTAMFPEGLSP